MPWKYGHPTLLAAFLFILSACAEDPGKEVERKDPEVVKAAEKRSLEAELEKNPGSVDARLSLSALLEEAADLSGAVRIVEQGISRDSTSTVLWNRLASLRLRSTDTAGALSALNVSLRSNPGQADILLEAGFIHAARNDSVALQMADRVLALPDRSSLHTMARYLKGVYYGNTGQTGMAIGQYDECIRSDFNFTDAYIEKGILQLEGGMPEQALMTFEKALLIANTYADAYYWKGRCLESLGRPEEASDHYAKALGLDDSLKAAGEGIERIRRQLKNRKASD